MIGDLIKKVEVIEKSFDPPHLPPIGDEEAKRKWDF